MLIGKLLKFLGYTNSSPANGELWYDGTDFNVRTGGATKALLSGTVPVANGGTGAATLTSHGILLGNGTGTIGATAEGATGEVLVGVTGGNPVFGAWLPQGAAKTADESVTSSTTMQNDDHLSFAGVAGATYQVTVNLKLTANASGGFKWRFVLPSGGSGRVGTQVQGVNVADVDVTAGNGVTGAFTVANTGVISGYITFGDAGTAQFQWAQNASFGTATILKRGCNLFAIRIS